MFLLGRSCIIGLVIDTKIGASLIVSRFKAVLPYAYALADGSSCDCSAALSFGIVHELHELTRMGLDSSFSLRWEKPKKRWNDGEKGGTASAYTRNDREKGGTASAYTTTTTNTHTNSAEAGASRPSPAFVL